MRSDFERRHLAQFGFAMPDKRLICESIAVEATSPSVEPPPVNISSSSSSSSISSSSSGPRVLDVVSAYMGGRLRDDVYVYDRAELQVKPEKLVLHFFLFFFFIFPNFEFTQFDWITYEILILHLVISFLMLNRSVIK